MKIHNDLEDHAKEYHRQSEEGITKVLNFFNAGYVLKPGYFGDERVEIIDFNHAKRECKKNKGLKKCTRNQQRKLPKAIGWKIRYLQIS